MAYSESQQGTLLLPIHPEGETEAPGGERISWVPHTSSRSLSHLQTGTCPSHVTAGTELINKAKPS